MPVSRDRSRRNLCTARSRRGSLYPSTAIEKEPVIGSAPVAAFTLDGIGITFKCVPDCAAAGNAEKHKIATNKNVRIFPSMIFLRLACDGCEPKLPGPNRAGN